MKNISNFNDLSDYMPILNSAIISDLIIIGLIYYGDMFRSKMLMEWYEKYRLSAVIADVLILVIGLVLARGFYYKIFKEYNLMYFYFLVLAIQIIHDLAFYKFFMCVPKGKNKMLDLFKSYAKEVGVNAILGDSFMISITVFLAAYLADKSLHYNIITLIFSSYLIPYFIYSN